MKLSGKLQVLWVLVFVLIHSSDSDDAEEDNLSRSRFHGAQSSPEMSCVTRRGQQQGVCRKRSECRKPSRDRCRIGRDPVVCCLDDGPPVVKTTTRRTTVRPRTTKRVDNVEQAIDITFPNCGNRSPNVTQSNTASTTRRRGFLGRSQPDSIRRFVIVGGKEAKSNSWPWMTAIFRTAVPGGPKRFLCGASLISRRYVLTAAHCFDGEKGQLDPSKFSIVVGSHNTKDGTEYPVSNILLHHGYQRKQYYNDLSVLKIGKQVVLTKKAYPVCLPSDGLRKQISLNENNVTVTGWGDTTFGGVNSKVLQEVSVPIVPLKECNASYSTVARTQFPRGVTNVFICAGLKEGGKDACQGDSGGPMVNKLKDNSYVQLGVVSFGYGCAQAGYPGVYTRLSKYTKWLYDNTDLGR